MLIFFKKYWSYILLGILSLLITWSLFLPGYFPHHDDLQVMRIFEMRKCLEDLQIPCRWVSDMGYGNGFPLFNYYSVLPYYIGALLSFIFSFIFSAKLLFLIPLVLAPFSMYFLSKELFGKIPGFIAAVLYLFAPYRAVDSYVRGAIAESFAIAIVPLIFYLSLRLIKQKNYFNFAFTSISFAFFLTSHNIMTLLFFPLIIVWIIFWLYLEKFKNWKLILTSILLGLGLAAFFILPAFLEKNLVQAESLKSLGLNFRAHFVTVDQLFFSRFWGYGGSAYGENDGMSFQLGWPAWQLVVASLFVMTLSFILRSGKKFISTKKTSFSQSGAQLNSAFKLPHFMDNQKIGFSSKLENLLSRPQTFSPWKFINFEEINKYKILFLGLFLVFLFSAFMMHIRSAFIWERIELLHFTQFPWRFLSISIFVSSLIGGLVIHFLIGNLQKFMAIVIFGLAVLLNFNYFKPESHFLNLDDQEKLTGELWRIQQQAGILDFLPTTAVEPKGPAPLEPEIISGIAETSDYETRSNYFKFRLKVDNFANIEVPVFDFPNWRVLINGESFIHNHENKLGRIRIDLPPGNYKVEGYFQNTVVRNIANVVSLTSLFVIVLIFFKRKLWK